MFFITATTLLHIFQSYLHTSYIYILCASITFIDISLCVKSIMDEDLPSLVLGVEEVSCADASFQQNNSNEYFHDVGIERDDNAMSFSRWQRISETVWNKIDPNYHIRSHLSEVTKPDLPLLTISALTFVWISYIYGIVYLTAMQSAQGSVWLVESPPQETLVFRTVAQWPQCVDARAQVWRLLSFQLVHNGE